MKEHLYSSFLPCQGAEGQMDISSDSAMSMMIDDLEDMDSITHVEERMVFIQTSDPTTAPPTTSPSTMSLTRTLISVVTLLKSSIIHKSSTLGL